jgi:predicted ester cyclase
MGPKENVACRWFADVWNKKDGDAIGRLATPDMIDHGPDGSHRSPAEFAIFHKALTSALPDLWVDVKHCVEGRDMIADGMPKPSGRPIEISGLTLVRVADGKCAEGWDDYDTAELMRQLGAAV